MEQNMGRLDTGRMRHMLMKLQEDLGISCTAVPLSYSTSPKSTYREYGRSSSVKTTSANIHCMSILLCSVGIVHQIGFIKYSSG